MKHNFIAYLSRSDQLVAEGPNYTTQLTQETSNYALIGIRMCDFTSQAAASLCLIIIIIITAIEFSLGGSSPYTSTDKTNIYIYT